MVNVVQVAPSAQGAFAADLVGAPQAHVGPSEPKTLVVALMAQVAAAQNSMMKDPLQESSHDVDRQCPPSQLQALDVEQDTQVELAELIRVTSSPSDDETSRFTTSSSASPPIKSCSDSSDRVGDQ